MADGNGEALVVLPSEFQARAAKPVCSASLAASLTALFAAYDCFKDELPSAPAHGHRHGGHSHGHGQGHNHGHGGGGQQGGNYNPHNHRRGGPGGHHYNSRGHGQGGHGHGHNHNHNHNQGGGARPSPRVGLTHVEKLHRDVTALLNKINSSNSNAIELKVLRLLEPSNANLIIRAVLQAAIVHGTYMRFLVGLVKRVASKYDIQQELATYGTAFIQDLEDGLTKASGLDYADYDGFCKFTALKAQLAARQQLQAALASESLLSHDADAHCLLLADQLDRCANDKNDHMMGMALGLLAGLLPVPAATQERLQAIYADHKDGGMGKKNVFQLEALLAGRSAL